MASIDPIQLQIALPEELSAILEATRKELLAAREALSEERIRTIVREELAAYTRRQVLALRSGRPLETK